MPFYLLLALALVQGLTEFLPVSSSAHLVLLHAWTGTEADSLALDIAVHLGSIAAVILYLWPECRRVLVGLGRLVRGDPGSPEAFLALCLVVATVPVVIVGGLLAVTGTAEALRSVAVIGWTMVLFGLLLWWLDRTRPATRPETGWTLRHALQMGLWQVLALIPGTSRSGITITAARALGYDRTSAARLSMLMSIPTILASGAVLALDVGKSETSSALLGQAAVAAALAFVAAYAALVLMIRWIPKVSFTPYVIYRVALGLVLLWIAYA